MANRVQRVDNPLEHALDSVATHVETARFEMQPTRLSAGFLARIEAAARTQEYASLGVGELNALHTVFSSWAFYERTVKGIPYYLADRALVETIQAPELVSYQKDGHRIVAPKDNKIAMIAQGAMRADDVACLCQIERRVLGIPEAEPKRNANEATQPLNLDEQVAEIVRLLGSHSKKEIAEKLNVTPGAIGKRVTGAMERNGYKGNEAGFIQHAFRFDQIDTSHLPPATGAQLTDIERALLTYYPTEPVAQAAAAMGFTAQTIGNAWRTIVIKLGVRRITQSTVWKSRMEAYLVALRDGLLDEVDNA